MIINQFLTLGEKNFPVLISIKEGHVLPQECGYQEENINILGESKT